MRMNVVRDKRGTVIGTFQADEVQATSGTVAVSPELKGGLDIESIEVTEPLTYDVDALHKSLKRKKGKKGKKKK